MAALRDSLHSARDLAELRQSFKSECCESDRRLHSNGRPAKAQGIFLKAIEWCGHVDARNRTYGMQLDLVVAAAVDDVF